MEPGRQTEKWLELIFKCDRDKATPGPYWANLSRQTSRGRPKSTVPCCQRGPSHGETTTIAGLVSEVGRRRATWTRPVPRGSPDLSVCGAFRQPAQLPRWTRKPRRVSHTLAAQSAQGRGGDEAECLLAAVKSLPQSSSCTRRLQ